MSCDISAGRSEGCKTGIGGIDIVYFANYVADLQDAVTYDVTNTDLITDVNGITNLYKFSLKGNNSFTQKIVSSRENGTTYVEQTLTIDLKGLDVATTKQIKLLAYGRPIITVKRRDGQYLLMGLQHGADLTEASIESGTAQADFNGYKLTFVSMEKIPANHLNCTTEATLATLFSSATIVS